MRRIHLKRYISTISTTMTRSINNFRKRNFIKGRLVVFLLTLFCFSITTDSIAQKIPKSAKDKFDKKSLAGKQKDGSYIVPTSQIIDPAGTTITFPGRPVDLALNPDETILAVKT